MSRAIDQLGTSEGVDRAAPPTPAATDHPHGRGAGPDPTAAPPADGREAGRRRAVVGALTAVLALPLVVAVGVQRSPRWYPSVDLAQIEMRVRDVFAHPPLVGLGGRIVGYGTQGSHPGPISFYALAPLYRLFGSSAWALQVAGAGVNVVALGLAVWMGHRRWGAPGAAVTAAGLALLMRVYGPQLLTIPWNPHFPILWWPVVLLAVWSVLCRDVKMLPVAVVAGTMCAQTHVPYVGMVGGLAALTAAGLVVMAAWPALWSRVERSRLAGRPTVAALAPATTDPAARRRLVRWSVGSTVLALVLWLPPIVQQLTNHPGNLAILVENFRHPSERPLGMGNAWDLLLLRADPRSFLSVASRGATTTPAVVLLVTWLASVAVAVRLRHGKLLRLHLVVAAALVLGLVSISRIFGLAWLYLTYWLSGTVALTLGAVGATAVVAVAAVLRRPAHEPGHEPGQEPAGARRRPAWLAPAAFVAPVALGLLVLVPAALATGDMVDALQTDPQVSEALRELAPATSEALAAGDLPGGGDGTYLVTWADPVDLGSTGFSLLLDLERRGFEVRAERTEMYELGVRPHRTIDREDADGEVHVSVGDADIEDWRSRPGVTEVASYEPRTSAERAEARRLRREVIERLEARGLSDLAEEFEVSHMSAAIDVRTPLDLTPALDRLAAIPDPVSVFVSEVQDDPATTGEAS